MKQLKQIANEKALKGVKLYVGESIERFCERAEKTGAPIEISSPIIFTERKDGVLPEYDIRTDKWELAQKAMNEVAEGHRKTRTKRIQAETEKALKGEQGKEQSGAN